MSDARSEILAAVFSRHPRAPKRHPRARPEDLSTRRGIQKSDTVSGPADPRVKPEDDVRGPKDDGRGPKDDGRGPEDDGREPEDDGREPRDDPPGPDFGAAHIASAAARLLARVAGVRPNRVTGPPADVFLDRVSTPAIGATVERAATLEGFPAAVRRYLASRYLAPSVALQPHPALRALDWSGTETHDTIALDERVSVGLALGAIAETGSLVFHSSPDAPTLFAFLPVHHIVAVEASRVWPWLEDYVAAYAGEPQPRNVNLITGASGTTDIEGTLVHGAHGPGFLHVVLIGESPMKLSTNTQPSTNNQKSGPCSNNS